MRRIRPGMTLAEVEALLGGPEADTVEMPAYWPAYRWHRKWKDWAARRKRTSGRTGARWQAAETGLEHRLFLWTAPIRKAGKGK